MTGFLLRGSFIPGPISASPSNTQGRSRMLELGSSGSVRGVASNGHPYRDPRSIPDIRRTTIELPESVRVSDAGPVRAVDTLRGRRPKASDERTRGKALPVAGTRI